MNMGPSRHRWTAWTAALVVVVAAGASPGLAAVPVGQSSVPATIASMPGRPPIAAPGSGRDLAAPAPSDCSDYSGYQQPFAYYYYGYKAYTGETGLYQPADSSLDVSFDIAPLGAGALDKLRWWGVSIIWDPTLPGFVYTYCDKDDVAATPYDLVFYADDGGEPGQVLARRTVVPSYFVTSDCWDCVDLNVYVEEYAATLADPVDATEVSWIGIERWWGGSLPDGTECEFAWVATPPPPYSYDGSMHQLDEASGVWSAKSDDLTFCTDIKAAQPSYKDIFYGNFEKGDLRYWSKVVGGP